MLSGLPARGVPSATCSSRDVRGATCSSASGARLEMPRGARGVGGRLAAGRGASRAGSGLVAGGRGGGGPGRLGVAVQAKRGEARVHIVEPGDTLWVVAEDNGVALSDVMRLNPLLVPEQITVGQIVQLSPGSIPKSVVERSKQLKRAADEAIYDDGAVQLNLPSRYSAAMPGTGRTVRGVEEEEDKADTLSEPPRRGLPSVSDSAERFWRSMRAQQQQAQEVATEGEAERIPLLRSLIGGDFEPVRIVRVEDDEEGGGGLAGEAVVQRSPNMVAVLAGEVGGMLGGVAFLSVMFTVALFGLNYSLRFLRAQAVGRQAKEAEATMMASAVKEKERALGRLNAASVLEHDRTMDRDAALALAQAEQARLNEDVPPPPPPASASGPPEPLDPKLLKEYKKFMKDVKVPKEGRW